MALKRWHSSVLAKMSAGRQQQQYAVWLCTLCLVQLAAAAPLKYEPRLWNRSCNYTVSNIPAHVFFASSTQHNSTEPLFPISPGYRITSKDGSMTTAQAACFGPGMRVNQTLVAAGIKMPCGYFVKANGLVDYWEESVCELTFRSNCYCYALNKQHNDGYCIPGYNSVGGIEVDYSDCRDAVKKVRSDGGKLVSREEVYSNEQPQKGHYIALVLWPKNDFHFFRRDASGTWSQKRGDTFVTNTYTNGTAVLDVEDPAILGAYKQFCGYFLVDPDSHDDSDSGWTYSSTPKRLGKAEQQGYTITSTPLPHPSSGWMRLSYPYLLFGLDAAVFESGERHLPWQLTSSSSGDEAGQHTSVLEKGAAGTANMRSSSSSLKPHWVSHAQHRTSIQERDRAVQYHYQRYAAKVS